MPVLTKQVRLFETGLGAQSRQLVGCQRLQAARQVRLPAGSRFRQELAARLGDRQVGDPPVGGVDGAVRRAYVIALGRPPSAEELIEATSFLQAQEASYRSAATADTRTLAMIDFCQVLLGLNEFAYVS